MLFIYLFILFIGESDFFVLQALKKEQERTIEELKDHQQQELDRMADKLEKESRDEEARKLNAFEVYRLRAISEVRSRQATELSSRNDMDTDESHRVCHTNPILLSELLH